MSDNLEAILARAQAGDAVSLGQLLSAIEKVGPSCLKLKQLQSSKKPALRIGITGPPGSGKSTLIGELLKILSKTNQRIGVLAIDPTSPISQGAILGDRIRYAESLSDHNIFVRSLGTRGSLGGLSASAYLMLRAFDACHFDIVIIETVGIGQVEVDIMNVADIVTLVLVPESGDSIQAMKAGIMEVADVIVINKADRPGAEALKREVEAAVNLRADENIRGVEIKKDVLSTSALNHQGVAELAATILENTKKLDVHALRAAPKRLRAEARALMRAALEAEAEKRIAKIESVELLVQLF